MKNKLKNIYSISKLFGFDPLRFLNTIRGIPWYFRNLSELKRQKGNDTEFLLGNKYPILDEHNLSSGTISGQYFHQDLLVARRIYENRPKRHVDIGSRIDGFVAHVAVFREIEIIDIRPQESKVKHITVHKADLMQLSNNMENYCDSISSLHAIEHFGLGRYGDPIDYNGHLKAINNIHKMLIAGGSFYFSVPIGMQRIEFNGLRVFSLKYLLDVLKNKFEIIHFSYVNDEGELFENIELSKIGIDSNFNCDCGCGIFELTKI